VGSISAGTAEAVRVWVTSGEAVVSAGTGVGARVSVAICAGMIPVGAGDAGFTAHPRSSIRIRMMARRTATIVLNRS
jgi:hypothetical protein